MIYIDIFRHGAYMLYKNPILFLLPSIGSAISIIVEITFITGLYNNNSSNYFPYSDILVLVLFFVAFVTTFFQLVIVRNIILKKASSSNSNYYGGIVVDLFIIYSIYALALIYIGDYESGIVKSFAAKSDRFSLYTFKLKSHNDIVTIIPFGILLSLLSAINSFLFNMWMVQYMFTGYQITNGHGVSRSLKNIIAVITISEDKRTKTVPLFLVTLVISILGFMLTNIAIVDIGDSLNLYILHFVILSVMGALYSPFFLVCLFLIVSPRSYIW